MSTPCFSTFVDVKFNGKNYKEWSVTVRMILLGLGLIEHIDGTSPLTEATTSDPSAILDKWREADHQAMAVISQSVEIDFRLSIASLPTAQKIWNHLSEQSNKNQFHPVQSSHSSSMSPSMDPRLFVAVRSGDVALLRQLHAEDANLLNSSTPHGNTTLHLAVIFRQDEFAKDLCLKRPSLLSVANGDGNTPLLLAAALGIQPIVDFVIVLPASPASPIGDVEDGKHMPTEVTMDLELPREETRRFARRFRARWVMKKEVESLSTANQEGPNVTSGPATVPMGHSALNAWYPYPSADVEEGNHKLRATNKMGNNALHEALRNGHGEVALVLLKAEPELARRVNNNEESPLYMACYRSLEVVVEELLRWPTASHEGPNGETALHAAVTVGHSVAHYCSEEIH